MSDLENQRLLEQISQLAGKLSHLCKHSLPMLSILFAQDAHATELPLHETDDIHLTVHPTSQARSIERRTSKPV